MDTSKMSESGRGDRMRLGLGDVPGLESSIRGAVNQATEEKAFVASDAAIDNARVQLFNSPRQASMRERLSRGVDENARDVARHELLLQRLTPEIEETIQVLLDCCDLGLVDLEAVLTRAHARREQRRRLGNDY